MAIQAAGITEILDFLDTNLTYIALEDGGSEYFRKATSVNLIDADTLIKEIELDITEGNGNIDIVDIFGFGATITPNSGLLFDEKNVAFTKSSNETLVVSYELQILEG